MNKPNQYLNDVSNTLLGKVKMRYNPGASARMLSSLLLLSLLFSECKRVDSAEEVNNSEKPVKQAATTSSVPDFTIAVIPDTQYYTGGLNGGTQAMFTAQINWIKNNRVAENIVYVAHLGDMTDHGDNVPNEWVNASNAMYALETPYTGFPNGIPYGSCVGNHDQTPNQGHPLTASTTLYNQYFGRSHFAGRAYYGGNYLGSQSNNNDSHWDKFSAGGLNFVVIYMEYDGHSDDTNSMISWATTVLNANPSSKAIIVTHYMGEPTNSTARTTFSTQGQAIYNTLKNYGNVFMFLGGHVGGEGYRSDTNNGKTIKTFISDYQFGVNGGNGIMRLYKISRDNDLIDVKTYSPYTGAYYTAAWNQFKKPLFHETTTTRSCDFVNDGKTDLSFFNNGVWKVYGQSNVSHGTTGDVPVPGDYNGDGQAEKAVFRAGTVANQSKWYVLGGSTITYGTPGDIPVPADYDGDGITDIGVWRPSTGEWFRMGQSVVVYGQNGDIPVPGDYNGDGKVDPAVYRPSNFTWYILGVGSYAYGATGCIPVPGDYNADGKTERAFFRVSDGGWLINGSTSAVIYGQNGDIPAPGDYDGDGDTDKAYYRAGTLNVSGGTSVTFGSVSGGDKLLNLPYAIRKSFFP